MNTQLVSKPKTGHPKLSPREQEVLDLLKEGCFTGVVAQRLGMKDKKQVETIKTNIRRKIARAKQFLRTMKKYDDVLYRKRMYKGIN